MTAPRSEPLRVGFVTLVDPTGESGQNLYSRSVAAAVARREDVELTLICPRPSTDLPADLRGALREHVFLSEKVTRSVRWQLDVQRDLATTLYPRLADGQLDALVTPMKPGLVVPPLIAKLHDVPQILLVEGMLARNVRKLAPFPGAGLAAEAVGFLNATFSDHVFAAYEEGREWMTNYPLVDTKKTSVLTHGIDTELFSPTEEGVDIATSHHGGEDVTIGFVGSFKSYHCLDLLVDACEKLTDEGKDLSLLLVGDGPEHDAIRQRVRDKGLDSRTTFTGFVDHEQVPAYISSCDILYGVVDPDHWGSPMKVFEYLACGRPVVAYGSPGIDFVGRIGAGCLVDAVSRSAVVTALSQLIEASPERRAKMGAVGRSYVLDNHTWAAYADRIVDAITESR